MSWNVLLPNNNVRCRMRNTLCLPSMLLMLCATGCQIVDTHATVRRALPDVTSAILLSWRKDLASGTRNLRLETNEISGLSFSLTVNEYKALQSLAIDAMTTAIRATTVYSNETSIAVRCDRTTGGCLFVSTQRNRSAERKKLTAIVKMLNIRE